MYRRARFGWAVAATFGLPTAVLLAAAAAAVAAALEGTIVPIPGLRNGIDVIRVGPPVLALLCAPVLLEGWEGFEHVGTRPIWALRGFRSFSMVVAVVAGATVMDSASAETGLVESSCLLGAVTMVAIVLIRAHWWLVPMIAFYLLLLRSSSVATVQSFGSWSVVALAVAVVIYVACGSERAWVSWRKGARRPS